MQLTQSTINQIKNPGQLQENFIKYLEEAGLSIDNSKTIAAVALYDQRQIAGTLVTKFFTGTFDSTNTNVVGSFVRPQSEHVMITHIRVADAVSATVNLSNWIPGVATAATKNARISILNNSEQELKKFPLTEFIAGLTTKDVGLLTLEEPILWQGQTELDLTFEAVSNPIANKNLRITLIGIGLI